MPREISKVKAPLYWWEMADQHRYATAKPSNESSIDVEVTEVAKPYNARSCEIEPN